MATTNNKHQIISPSVNIIKLSTKLFSYLFLALPTRLVIFPVDIKDSPNTYKETKSSENRVQNTSR